MSTTAPILARTAGPPSSSDLLTEIAQGTGALKTDIASDTSNLTKIGQNLGLLPPPAPVPKPADNTGPIILVVGLLVLVGVVGVVLYVVRRGGHK